MFKIKRSIFSICLVVILLISNVRNVVFASTYTPVIEATPQFVQSAKYFAPLLLPFAPEVALIACVAISAGVVYENREELLTISGYIYQKMVASGYAVNHVVDKGFSLGADALNFVNTQIDFLNSSPTLMIPYSSLNTTNFNSLPLLSISAFTIMTLQFGTQELITGVAQGDTFELQGIDMVNHFDSTHHVKTRYYTTYTGQSLTGISFSDSVATYAPTIPLSVFQDKSVCPPYAADDVISIPSDISIATDIPITGDWTGDLTGTKDWTTTFPRVSDVPVDVPVDPPIDGSITMPSDNTLRFPSLSIVADRFPFSIPFDLINSFKSLSAEKVTPKIDVTFPSIYGSTPTGFKIDFTQFNKIVLIIRYFILLIFSVNLIKLTRNLIRG